MTSVSQRNLRNSFNLAPTLGILDIIGVSPEMYTWYQQMTAKGRLTWHSICKRIALCNIIHALYVHMKLITSKRIVSIECHFSVGYAVTPFWALWWHRAIVASAVSRCHRCLGNMGRSGDLWEAMGEAPLIRTRSTRALVRRPLPGKQRSCSILCAGHRSKHTEDSIRKIFRRASGFQEEEESSL